MYVQNDSNQLDKGNTSQETTKWRYTIKKKKKRERKNILHSVHPNRNTNKTLLVFMAKGKRSGRKVHKIIVKKILKILILVYMFN